MVLSIRNGGSRAEVGGKCGGSSPPYPLRTTSANADSRRLRGYGSYAGTVERGIEGKVER